MIQTTGKIVGQITENLKDRPLVLALIIVNVMFLFVTSGVLYSVKQSGERRDKLISDLIQFCAPKRGD